MSQYLPYDGIKWLNQKENNKFVNSIKENSSDGYKLEVYLEYPDELHEMHTNYPLALEKLEIVIIGCQIIAVILQMNVE